jgi:hypothetical protein
MALGTIAHLSQLIGEKSHCLLQRAQNRICKLPADDIGAPKTILSRSQDLG